MNAYRFLLYVDVRADDEDDARRLAEDATARVASTGAGEVVQVAATPPLAYDVRRPDAGGVGL